MKRIDAKFFLQYFAVFTVLFWVIGFLTGRGLGFDWSDVAWGAGIAIIYTAIKRLRW